MEEELVQCVQCFLKYITCIDLKGIVSKNYDHILGLYIDQEQSRTLNIPLN